MKIFPSSESIKNTALVKTIISTLILAMAFVPFTLVLAEESQTEGTTMVFIIDNNTYTANGELIVMDVSPMIIEERTMLPIRYAATPLGADILWDGEEKKVTVFLGERSMELWVGENKALVNGAVVPIDANNPNVKPLIVNGRTMLPLRFVTENLGCDLEWDAVTKKVTITKTMGSDQPIDSSIIPPFQLEPSIPPIDLTPVTPIDPLTPSTPSTGMISTAKPPITNLSKSTIDKLVLSVDTSYLIDIWDYDPVGVPRKVMMSESGFPVVLRTGRGYDVFGKYASVDSLKQSVLDLEKLITDQRLERIRYDQSYDEQTTSESIRSYSNTISTKISASGNYFAFGGSVKTNFDSTRTQQLNNYFSTQTWMVKKYGVYVLGTTDLKKYLNDEAKKIINDSNVPASTVFDNYGHYVVVDTITGGRIDYNITASSNSSSSFENFRAAAKADFNVVVLKASAGVEYQNIKNKSEYDSNKRVSLYSYGGEFGLDTGQFTNDPQIKSKWESTLEEHGTLVEFGNTTARPLIPIWDLCDNSTRANYLKAEFDKLNLAQGNQWPTEKYVVDIQFVSDQDKFKARAKCPPGYMLIDADLNSLAGSMGDYIYLTYKLGENVDEAYTDFFMEYVGSPQSPETKLLSHNSNYVHYTRIGTDLNKGLNYNFTDVYGTIWKNTDYIYMWTTKAKTLPPIKGIAVAMDNPDNKEPEWDSVYWQNTTTPADVNKGVKGKWIFIKFTR